MPIMLPILMLLGNIFQKLQCESKVDSTANPSKRQLEKLEEINEEQREEELAKRIWTTLFRK